MVGRKSCFDCVAIIYIDLGIYWIYFNVKNNGLSPKRWDMHLFSIQRVHNWWAAHLSFCSWCGGLVCLQFVHVNKIGDAHSAFAVSMAIIYNMLLVSVFSKFRALGRSLESRQCVRFGGKLRAMYSHVNLAATAILHMLKLGTIYKCFSSSLLINGLCWGGL